MHNTYDDDRFFAAYADMPRSKYGLEAAGEWHQLQPLFPDLEGKSVLDLGCGYGWHCKYAVQRGASCVLGLDTSARMLERAAAENGDTRITYVRESIEQYAYPAEAFDLVISNLALHYIADLEPVYRKVYRTLRAGGRFLFNIEHPIFTAGVREDWIYGEDGEPLYWPVDRYYSPGARETIFLGQRVVKQHHTLTQILNPLLHIGFCLEAVEEALPPEEWRERMPEEMRRPMMLLVRAVKEPRH